MSFQNKNKKEFENVYHKNKFNVYRSMAGNNNEKYSYQLYEEAGKRMSEGRY